MLYVHCYLDDTTPAPSSAIGPHTAPDVRICCGPPEIWIYSSSPTALRRLAQELTKAAELLERAIAESEVVK